MPTKSRCKLSAKDQPLEMRSVDPGESGGHFLSLLRALILDLGIAKVLPHSNRKESSPRSVRAQVARPQGTRAEAFEQVLLRQPEIEAASQVHVRAPLPLPANPLPRPCVEILRNVFAEHEGRVPENLDAPQRRLTERPYPQLSLQQVAREQIALRVRASKVSRIGRAEVGIGLVVRRSQVELGITIDPVAFREPPALLRRGHPKGSGRLGCGLGGGLRRVGCGLGGGRRGSRGSGWFLCRNGAATHK